MLDQDTLINFLNQPGVKSGTDLGEMLGVSRTAVQKRIRSLQDNGLPIKAVPGVGYMLDDGVRLLSKHDLLAKMTGTATESVELFQSIPSTNTYLLGQNVMLRRARVCVSESQSAGRGRRGNDWQSAPYRNVMLSLSWGFDHWPETITALGLAVALVMAELLNRDYAIDAQIKWPNDLLVGDDKLGGILIDVAGESSGVCNVVIGIGLNVHQPDWSKEHAYRWCDLASLGVDVDRNQLIAELVNDLTAMLLDFERAGFVPLVERWNSLSRFAGARVRVGEKSELLARVSEQVDSNANGIVEGKMRGVDASGALLVVDEAGRQHRFSDSSVSVRKV